MNDSTWDAWKTNRDRNPFPSLPDRPSPVNGQVLAFELPKKEHTSSGGIIMPRGDGEAELPRAVVLASASGSELSLEAGDLIVFGHHAATKVGSFGHLMVPEKCVYFVGSPPEEANV
tara:strand:- start:13650 stop:14000 length:351 start_codon:yes stop_codon:yes gene_type:complete